MQGLRQWFLFQESVQMIEGVEKQFKELAESRPLFASEFEQNREYEIPKGFILTNEYSEKNWKLNAKIVCLVLLHGFLKCMQNACISESHKDYYSRLK